MKMDQSLSLSIGIFVGIGIISLRQLNQLNHQVETLGISTLKADITSQKIFLCLLSSIVSISSSHAS